MYKLLQIKWAWQRVVRGYDDRVTWGFDGYFIQIIPALKEFCEHYPTLEHASLNPDRMMIFKQTLNYIYAWESQTYEDEFLGTRLSELMEYVGKHIGYYWD